MTTPHTEEELRKLFKEEWSIELGNVVTIDKIAIWWLTRLKEDRHAVVEVIEEVKKDNRTSWDGTAVCDEIIFRLTALDNDTNI